MNLFNRVPPRRQIGKFGIGKLATYILANEVTYICKADDGIIRAVMMDYREIGRANTGSLHTAPLPLEVRRLSDDDLSKLLITFSNGDNIQRLISNGCYPTEPDYRRRRRLWWTNSNECSTI